MKEVKVQYVGITKNCTSCIQWYLANKVKDGDRLMKKRCRKLHAGSSTSSGGGLLVVLLPRVVVVTILLYSHQSTRILKRMRLGQGRVGVQLVVRVISWTCLLLCTSSAIYQYYQKQWYPWQLASRLLLYQLVQLEQLRSSSTGILWMTSLLLQIK